MPFDNVVGGSVRLNDGHFMPLIGLGTYKINGDCVLPALDAALRVGYRCFDTAKKYGNETELGDAFQVLLPKHGLSREDIFITSKIFPSKENWADECRKGIEDSLLALKTSYIDLYLVHYPTYDVFSEEADKDPQNSDRRKTTYQTLEEAQANGKVRSIGVSNYEVRHLEELDRYAKRAPAVNQVEFHPHFTRSSIRSACLQRGIVFAAFGSLGRMAPSLIEDQLVASTASDLRKTSQEILLAFATSQHIPVCPKTTSEERLKVNFEACKLRLDEDRIATLEGLCKPNIEGNYIRAYGWRVL